MADIELTVKQTAKELSVTPRTVRNWCTSGKLVAWKGSGKFGQRWLVSVQSIREKRSEASADFPIGKGGNRLLAHTSSQTCVSSVCRYLLSSVVVCRPMSGFPAKSVYQVYSTRRNRPQQLGSFA